MGGRLAPLPTASPELAVTLLKKAILRPHVHTLVAQWEEFLFKSGS